ncbi:MAG: PEGA domain-containing protein [Bryobacteraceae bacterium]|nr:PEGA domain-containing protein [Bryobacteraceae bacterium]MDW8378373.1 PEGA domain-containing protein [Bryobacterales bacterium]
MSPEDRNRLETLLLEASQRLAAGDEEKALQALEQVLKIDPSNQHAILTKIQIHLRRGAAALQQRRYAEVRQHLHAVLAVKAVSQRAYRLLRQVAVAEDRQKRLINRRNHLLEVLETSREYGHFEVALPCLAQLVEVERELGLPEGELRSLQQQLELELRLTQEAERRIEDAISRQAWAEAGALCERAVERWPKSNRFFIHRWRLQAGEGQAVGDPGALQTRLLETAHLLEQKGLFANAVVEWEYLARLSPGWELAADGQRAARLKLAEQEWERTVEDQLDRLQQLWASEDYLGAEAALREIERQAPQAQNLEHWRRFLERARHFSWEETNEATERIRQALDCYHRDPAAAKQLAVEADSLDNYHPLAEPLLRQLQWLEGVRSEAAGWDERESAVWPWPGSAPGASLLRTGSTLAAGLDPSGQPGAASAGSLAGVSATAPSTPAAMAGTVGTFASPASGTAPAAAPPLTSAGLPLPRSQEAGAGAAQTAAPTTRTVATVSGGREPGKRGSGAAPTRARAPLLALSRKWLVAAGVVAVFAGVSPELVRLWRKAGSGQTGAAPAPVATQTATAPTPVEPAAPVLPSLRIVAELPLQLKLDGQPVGESQPGAAAVENLAEGKHQLELISQGMKETLNFEVSGRTVILPPAIRPAWVDVIVLGRQPAGWRLISSTPTGEVFVDDQPVGKLPTIDSFQFAEGERKLRLQIDPGQKLEQQLGVRSSDVLILWLRPLGTPLLTVSSNVDRVQVFLNGRYWGPTLGRQLSIWRLPPGKQRVRVQKDGYQPVPDQEVTIVAGKTQNVKFELTPLPKLATLQVQTDGAGYQIRMNGRLLGETDANGRFESKTIEPGDHRFEIAKPGYRSRTYDKKLLAGDTFLLSRADTRLELLPATLRLSYSPSQARVILRRLDGTGGERALSAGESQLAPGSYELTATANGFRGRSVRILLEPGRTQEVSLQLEALAAPPAPKPAAAASLWEGGATFTDRGDGFAAPPANIPYLFLSGGPFTGVIRFTATWEMRRNLTWLTHFRDFQNFVRWELNNRELTVTVVQNGKGKGRDQKHRIKDLNTATIRLQIDADMAQLTLESPPWKAEPVMIPAGLSGKFGFSTHATKFFLKDFQATR